MKRPVYLWQFAGLKHYADRSIIPASGSLWILLVVFAFYFLHFDMTLSALWGLCAVTAHWLGELWHQLGHAFAARRVGFPMQRVLLRVLIGISIYPSDEPELPGRTHILRALGGPAAGLLAAAFSAVVVFGLNPDNDFLLNLARFVLADNLLVYTIGALLPLGFNDGSTILKHLNQ